MATDRPYINPQPTINVLTPERKDAFVAVFGEKFVNTYQGPVHFIDNTTLSSPVAIGFYRRDFQYISKMANFEYQYRSWNGYNQELLDRYADIITKKLASIKTLLSTRISQISKLLEQNSVSMESTIYSNVLNTNVPVISGHARNYFLLLQELDRLNLMTGTANLMGVIQSSQRAEVEFQCKKAIRAFAAVLRNEVIKIYREADRMQNDPRGAGERDAQQQATLAAQGEALDEIGTAMDTEGKSDRGLDMTAMDPGQLIDEAAAASLASAKAGKRKPKEDAPVAPAVSAEA